MNYWLSFGEEVRGPYTLDQLRGFWSRGEVTALTPVCEDGADSWSQLGEMQDTLEPGRKDSTLFGILAVVGGYLGLHNWYIKRPFFAALQMAAGIFGFYLLATRPSNPDYDLALEAARENHFIGGVIFFGGAWLLALAESVLVKKDGDGREFRS